HRRRARAPRQARGPRAQPGRHRGSPGAKCPRARGARRAGLRRGRRRRGAPRSGPGAPRRRRAAPRGGRIARRLRRDRRRGEDRRGSAEVGPVMTILILWAVTAAVASATLVPLARRAAFAVGAIDVPDERHQHRAATARLRGLAVFGAFTLVVIVLLATGRVDGTSFSLPIFFGSAILVLGTGALDDVRRLRAHVKLLVEVGAALVVVYGGHIRITGISSPGGVVDLGWLAGPFTVLWIVLVTHAITPLGSLDGLAAGTSILALGSVAIIAQGFDFTTVAVLAAVLAGACAGFLVHNFHPATIFLGDSGSLFIGFSIGVLSSYARAKGTTGAITI